MKKFFLSHPDVILATVAFVLLAVLIGFFSWGINDVVFEIHQTTVPSNISSDSGFDLQAAEKINFRGISTSTMPSAATISANPNATTSIVVVTSTATSSPSK